MATGLPAQPLTLSFRESGRTNLLIPVSHALHQTLLDIRILLLHDLHKQPQPFSQAMNLVNEIDDNVDAMNSHQSLCPHKNSHWQ